MTTTMSHRRSLVLLALVAMFATLVTPVALAAHTTVREGDGFVTSVRWAGEDRYDTAALLAVEGTAAAIAEPAKFAILARGDDFPDALASGYLSAVYPGPILLTRPTSLPVPTLSRLSSDLETGLDVGDVYVVGGTAAISQAVQDQVDAIDGITTHRIEGADRIATAIAIAGEGDAALIGEVDGKRTAILARSDNFPDALAAGATARARRIPIYLTRPTSLDGRVVAAMQARGIEHVIIAGGEAAISAGVKAAVEESFTTIRLAGENRRETAVAFARFNVAELGFDDQSIGLARGDAFPDALAFAPYAGREEFSILLTRDPGVVSAAGEDDTLAALTELGGCTFDALLIPGGLAAVSSSVEAAARFTLTGSDCDGVDNTPPTLTRVVRTSDSSAVAVFDEPVTCTADVPKQFRFVADAGQVTPATSISCDSSPRVTLRFDAVVAAASGGVRRFVLPDVDGNVFYTPSGMRAARVHDLAMNRARPGGVVLEDGIEVTTTVDSTDEGSLRAAIIAANANPGPDTILLPAGLYELTIDGAGEDAAATGDLDVTDELLLVGAGSDTTVISQTILDRVFDISAGAVQISDVTIADGTTPAISGDDKGGNVQVRGAAEVIISSSVITNGVADLAGGGVENTGASLRLLEVEIDSNAAATKNGGGLHSTGTTYITGSTVSNNFAGEEGGGLWQSGGALEVEGMTEILSNEAGGDDAAHGGGGVYVTGGGELILTDVIVDANFASGVAGSGGGIFVEASSLDALRTTITGNFANRAGGGVEVAGGTVSFTDSVIGMNDAGANPGNGGGLHAGGVALVDLLDTDVTANSAVEGGGLWNGSATTLNVEGGLIAVNDASGAAADQGGGGLYNDGGTLSVLGSEIHANVASGASGSGGGVLNNGGSLTLSTSLVGGNVANRAGGGLEVVGAAADTSTTIFQVQFDTNTAGPAGSAAPGNGGGVHVSGDSDVDVDDSVFTGNEAAREGGGLWNGAGVLTITNSTVAANTAYGDASDDGGGGIFQTTGELVIADTRISMNVAAGAAGSGGGVQVLGGQLTITSADIVDNLANRAGGGVELDDTLAPLSVTITETVFDGNVAGPLGSASPGNGGGMHIGGAGAAGSLMATIAGATVTDNVAASEGGGFWNGDASLLDVSASAFDGNSAGTTNLAGDTTHGGGALFVIGGTLNVRGSTFDTNSATNGIDGVDVSNGGAIMNRNGTLLVEDSAFTANSADRAGGAIEVQASGDGAPTASATIRRSTFSGNSAGVNGGAVHTAGATSVNIEDDNAFTANTAAQEGGAVWNATGLLVIRSSRFEANVASGSVGTEQGGGAFFNVSGPVDVFDSTFVDNVADGATGNGAAIMMTGGSMLAERNTFVGGIAARAGGALELQESAAAFETTLRDNVFTGNSAGVNGGAVHTAGSPTVRIYGGSLSDNTAAQEGGAVWNLSGAMEIEGVDFMRNTANAGAGGTDQGGGAAFNVSGTLDITSSRFLENVAANTGSNGGAVMSEGGSLFITDSMFGGNSAARAGGSIEVQGTSTAAILRITVDTSIAGVNGGGIHVATDGLVTITDTAIRGNTAGGQGGGLWTSATGTATIDGTTLSGNDADTGGGLYSQGNTDVTASTFSANTATTAGTQIGNGVAFTDDLSLFEVTIVDGGTGVTSIEMLAIGVSFLSVALDGTCANAPVSKAAFFRKPDASSGCGTGGGQSVADLQVGALADNGGVLLPDGLPTFTHEPDVGSTLLDRRTTSSTVDQRDEPRPTTATADIGAVEKQ